jgi:hypothetical protein
VLVKIVVFVFGRSPVRAARCGHAAAARAHARPRLLRACQFVREWRAHCARGTAAAAPSARPPVRRPTSLEVPAACSRACPQSPQGAALWFGRRTAERWAWKAGARWAGGPWRRTRGARWAGERASGRRMPGRPPPCRRRPRPPADPLFFTARTLIAKAPVPTSIVLHDADDGGAPAPDLSGSVPTAEARGRRRRGRRRRGRRRRRGGSLDGEPGERG